LGGVKKGLKRVGGTHFREGRDGGKEISPIATRSLKLRGKKTKEKGVE